jgi:hypothetical protein
LGFPQRESIPAISTSLLLELPYNQKLAAGVQWLTDPRYFAPAEQYRKI